ncbi:MAG: fibronectin type III domain-containing protein, partial [Gammaproteobacteria bacterium]
NDGGAAVSDYLIRWALASAAANYLNAGGENGETSGIDDLMHTITGLTNGTTYEVQIAAVNSAGTGAWSAVHRKNPAQPPQDAPGALNIQPGSGLLTLSWTAPADDGGDDITGYAVRWAEGNDSSMWVNPPGEDGQPINFTDLVSADLVYVLGSLKAATTYEVQVAARNDAGTGMWSASVEGVTSSFNVDIDASGTVDSTDALLIARYLTGLRGDALVANLNLDATQTSIKVAAKINSGVLLGVLDIDGENGTTAADGIMFARYHLGVTEGAALTDGMSGVDPATVKMKILNLPMP